MDRLTLSFKEYTSYHLHFPEIKCRENISQLIHFTTILQYFLKLLKCAKLPRKHEIIF